MGNLPVINQSYYVEFTIPKVLSWGKDIIENLIKGTLRFGLKKTVVILCIIGML